MRVRRLEPLRSQQDVDVLGEPPEAVQKQRHASHDRIWNPQGVQTPRDFSKRLLDGALLVEMTTAFSQGPPRIAGQAFFVGQHASPGNPGGRCAFAPLQSTTCPQMRHPRTSFVSQALDRIRGEIAALREVYKTFRRSIRLIV